MMNDCEELKEQRKIAKQVLNVYKQQQTTLGVHTPPHMIVEIERYEQQIKELEAKLDALGCGEERLPNSLPRRASFFGREEEIGRALEALSPEERGWGLVIDGIGGIGKTALAVEVAYRCEKENLFDAFLFTTAKRTRLAAGGEQVLPDSAATLDEMLSEIARLLGRQGLAQRPAAEKPKVLREALLAESGAGRRFLLIFDNLEALTDAEQGAIYEFLRRLPNACKAIATSRRRAGDNAVWLRLEKLDWPASHRLIAAEMRRSSRLQRNLLAAGEERWQELYDAAGGSPLALRWLLGLMRMRNLSLDRALAVMRSGDNEDAPLHEFIYREARAEMGGDDWRTLGALSLFAAPASFAALTSVTGLSRTQLESTLERLDAYSLVDIDGPDGPYSLHPLTRRLAGEELAAQPDLVKALQRAFTRHWLDYAQRYGGHGKDDYKTYDRLEGEWPNLEAAANTLWALSGLPELLQDKEAARMIINMASALRQFLWFRGYWNERVRLSEWRYEAGKALGDWANAGWGAYYSARIHYLRKETEEAETWAGHMVTAMERGGTRRAKAVTTRLSGLVTRQNGDLAEAERLYKAALAEYRAIGKERDEAIVLNDLGEVAWEQNAYERAEDYYSEALALAEKLRDRELQATRLGNLGRLALNQGQLQKARTLCERALKLAQEVERNDLVASSQHRLAQVLEKEGRYAEALPLAEESLRINERLGHKDVGEARGLVARLREKVRQ